MGQEAAKLLLRQIELSEKDEDAEIVPETKVLQTKLIIRESSMRQK
jgi:DNA-binding LacI/PurR family transcriptional regulator